MPVVVRNWRLVVCERADFLLRLLLLSLKMSGLPHLPPELHWSVLTVLRKSCTIRVIPSYFTSCPTLLKVTRTPLQPEPHEDTKHRPCYYSNPEQLAVH